MTHFVLIPGAAHGAWCWHKLAPLLEAAGHRVTTPDLAGLGADLTPIAELSLARWADDVAALIAGLGERVVLVGHSRGGIVISEVAERIPERIERLVYLTAFLLADGQSLGEAAAEDSDSIIGPNLVADPAAGTWLIRPEAAIDGFFADCDPEDLGYVFARLRPEPLFSLDSKIHVTAARFGRVPRSYIECRDDRAITLACQRRMQAVWPCDQVIILPTSHSPFISAPDQLARALSLVANRHA